MLRSSNNWQLPRFSCWKPLSQRKYFTREHYIKQNTRSKINPHKMHDIFLSHLYSCQTLTNYTQVKATQLRTQHIHLLPQTPLKSNNTLGFVWIGTLHSSNMTVSHYTTHVGTDSLLAVSLRFCSLLMEVISDFSISQGCVCSPRAKTRIEIRGLGFLKQENRS